jgi:hypothetical protein
VTRSRRPARPRPRLCSRPGSDTVFFADALGGKNGHLRADANLDCVQDPKMSGEIAARRGGPSIKPFAARRVCENCDDRLQHCRLEARALTFAALRYTDEILRMVVPSNHTRAIESSPAE